MGKKKRHPLERRFDSAKASTRRGRGVPSNHRGKREKNHRGSR